MGSLGLYMSNTHRCSFYFLVLALMVISSIAFGDGKFFYREKVPVGVPYQRALLIFEDGKETLVLQSKYKTVEVEDMNSIAWVVPVPGVPELASMNAREITFIFFLLGLQSRPHVIPILQISIYLSVIVIICFVVAKGLNWFFAKLVKAGAKPVVVNGFRIAVWVVVGFVLIASILMPSLSKVANVDVLKAETVGIYDVKVIKGDDASAVTEWLEDNGFGFDRRDFEVFDQYIKKGWCFVTAKVSKKVDLSSKGAISEGLAAPLIMRFDTKEAIYPLALTGTTNINTEVLLYIFSDHKMECGDRLRLAFSGEKTNPFEQGSFSSAVEPNGFFSDVKTKLWQMCKFKGTLEPDQMKEDIVFKQAKDDEPYRKIRWH